MDEQLHHLEVGAGALARPIAVRARPGRSPGVFWLGGFKSDMRGTKAEALAAYAETSGRALVRFDYSGHGESGGPFEEGTISRWRNEALAVFEAFARGPQVVVGSSMGAWIALLLARELKERPAADARIAGMVRIAPAARLTEELMWPALSPEAKQAIVEQGVWQRPSAYGDGPYPITRALIEDGSNHLILNAPSEPGCPVRILQGVHDPDVPWRHAVKLAALLPQDDVVLTLVPDGDHRLSRAEDIERLLRAVDELDTPR